MNTIMALPAWQQWVTAGIKEPWLFAADEVDWPKTQNVEP
jgi:hypothetical protein